MKFLILSLNLFVCYAYATKQFSDISVTKYASNGHDIIFQKSCDPIELNYTLDEKKFEITQCFTTCDEGKSKYSCQIDLLTRKNDELFHHGYKVGEVIAEEDGNFGLMVMLYPQQRHYKFFMLSESQNSLLYIEGLGRDKGMLQISTSDDGPSAQPTPLRP